MAGNNASGLSTIRKGSIPTVFTYDSTAPGTTSVTTPITINASVLNPVYIEGQVQVVTAGGGTLPTVGLGVTSDGADLVALTATTATGFIPASNAVGKAIVTNVTTIHIKEGGTPAGTGVYRVIISAAGLNYNPTN